MRKYFRLPGLFLFILALGVGGCSGSGSSADPMGTGTVQFVEEYNAPTTTGGSAGAVVKTTAEVQPNSSLTLTVWVTNNTSDGRFVPVINEKVIFTLDSPENGARLAVLNDRTASNGQARVVYSAGNNLFPDVVRVTTGVGATASITITKTGTTNRGAVVSLSANQNPVAPLGFSTITATVTDNGKAVQGERVTFTLLTNNGAALTVLSGLTNAGGLMVTTYQAGNNQNQDVIQASLANGAAAQITMTKTTGIRGLVVALTASPTSVLPLGFSTITATVTDNGVAAQGERVTFALTTNYGASLSIQSGLTNASGQAVATYQAGNNNNQDVIQASLGNGATAQVIVTKTGVGPGRSIELASIPAIPLAPAKFAIVTATVKDSGNNLVSGATVRFTLTTSNGSISRDEVTTDGNGVARIVYYAWNNLATDILQATTDGGGFAQLIITKAGQLLGYTATMAAEPATFATGDWIDSKLTVTVVDNNNLPAQGLRVRFNPPSVGSTPASGNTTTGIDGKVTATFNYNTGAYVGSIILVAYVDVDDNGVQDPTDPTAAVYLTVAP